MGEGGSENGHIEIEKEAAIEQKMAELFEEKKELSPKERGLEFSKLLKSTEKLLEAQANEGQLKLKETILQTFQEGNIDKVYRDGYFYIIPKEKGGRLLAITDLHGDLTALKEAIREFMKDDRTHLVSLGDMVAGEDPDQVKTVATLLKLFNEIPERVHLLRGNCESDVAPVEGFGEQLGGQQGVEMWRTNWKRAQRVFNKMPLGFITENKIVGVHGVLPRPDSKEIGGEKYYRNLREINGLSDYTSDSTKLAGREVRRMLWGTIDFQSEEGYRGEKFYVTSGKEVEKQLEAIDANVLVRGHESSKLKKAGKGIEIDLEGKVGTFHSSHKAPDRRILNLPLDQEVKKLDEEMFKVVQG